ncbi:hypothetical protein J2S09_000488 [Bacillus fengqiuensis]|nr:hypothetical protein [Bacillus fengqiuensis]
MELIYCKQNVLKKLGYDFIEVHPPVILFKKGNIYPVFRDMDTNWVTVDEQGKEHIVASAAVNLNEDHWFNAHFDIKS